MTSGKRFRLSATERAEVWRRWKDGQSLHAIGRALGRAHPVVHLLLKRHGGSGPTARRRSRRALTLVEREDISRGIASGCSLRVIAQALRSLTWDRGLEMAQHKSFTLATDVQVYFCDPQSPWQRGSNENTNGLLRQYLPKTAHLSTFSQSDLDAIALRLNTRPRQTLGFQTPADKLQASVASTP